MTRRLRTAPDLPRAPRRSVEPDHLPGDRAGFVLYVGLNDDGTGEAGDLAELAEVAEALRDLARDLLPTAETYTALSLVPGGGSDDARDLRDRLTHLQPLPGPDTATPPRVAETA